MRRRLILTSYGLTTVIGRELIRRKLKRDGNLEQRKNFLFQEPHYSVEKMLVEACVMLGFQRENVILSGQQSTKDDLTKMDYIYVTEGNTFEVLSLIRERNLVSVFREAFTNGATYIGASAGAMIAGSSIEEAKSFDLNFVRMTEYEGLGLFDGIIIPHYTKSELERYVKNSPGIEDKYSTILYVENDGVRELVMEDDVDS